MPEVHGSIELEHQHRYLLACQVAAGKCVLDIASGEGYGSAMLAKVAAKVTGVDISEEAVLHAHHKYKAENLEFFIGSCAAIPLATASVDVVVSFETIEHHDEHEAMMREIKRVLRPGGVLVISSPDKLEFTDRPNQHNPHHVKELYKEEFKSLLEAHFTHQQMYGQKIIFGSAILCESGRTPSVSYEFVDNELFTSAGVPHAVYLVAVASDSHLPVFATGILEQQIADSDFTHFWRGLMAERDAQIGDLYHVIGNRDTQVDSLNQTVLANDTLIDNLNRTVADRDKQIIRLHHTISEQLSHAQAELARLSYTLAEREQLLQQILQSHSWRYTKPLRFLNRLLARLYRATRRVTADTARELWRQLPLSLQSKQKLKNFCFQKLSPFFNRTMAFRAWQSMNSPMSPDSRCNEQLAVGSIAQEKITYVPLLQGKPLKNKPAKLICFYLPQFHPIPENNEWWGEGFTEWHNVQPAQPQFEGHYQPHEPGELGYYGLLDPGVQQRQVELAKLYGIEGFCFYFYWFGGKRLLEAPTEQYLNDASLDLPFCLCWANENWSRRWDGLDSEILIAQQHSPADDLAFIQHIARYMRDPRYIRVDGRPLLLVYRPHLLPAAKETAQCWRDWCRNNDIGEIYLAYTQSFEIVDPGKYGFDAAIEFPPSNSMPPDITNHVTPLAEDFGSIVYDWRIFVERSEKYKQRPYKLFRSVCPSWDNTARRKNRSTVFLNSSPRLYQRWLQNAITDTLEHQSSADEPLIFINAWNEWAEGAHLEPDQLYGYAYLQATRDALSNTAKPTTGAILIVTHDCHPHGAQFLILETAKQLRACGFKTYILALGGGPLLGDFAQVGETLNAETADAKAIDKFLLDARAAGTLNAITSTVVSGQIVPRLKDMGFRVLSLIHELPGVIHAMKQESNAGHIAELADKILFPATMVYERFAEIAPIAPSKVVIRPQGLVRKNPYKKNRAEAHRIICARHDLPTDTRIVLNVAYVDARKGADLFVEIATQVISSRPDTTFIWVGHSEREMAHKVAARIEALGLQKNILFVGFDRDPLAYYAAASVYALTSREDPFPNVVLESAEVGVPVVAFKEASGAGDFILQHGGRLAEPLNIAGFSDQICSLLANPAAELPSPNMSLQQYALDLLHHLDNCPRVSVVVPNYNYAHYIAQRLDSIYNQTLPAYEVIVLDDASSDNSIEVINKYIDDSGVDAQLIINDRNSGSVFRQWQSGIAACKGDLIWIAEADDLAEPDFLRELAAAFEDRDLVLGYCQSKQMDASGNILADDYLEYSLEASNCCLTDYCRDGREEISKSMCIKNTIPNVSAVLFRRQPLSEVMSKIEQELFNLQVAGDWLVYLHVLMKGKVCHSKKSLNSHRRHYSSATNSLKSELHLQEIIQMQKLATSLVSPPDEVRALAKSYIDQLRNHFQISVPEGQA